MHLELFLLETELLVHENVHETLHEIAQACPTQALGGVFVPVPGRPPAVQAKTSTGRYTTDTRRPESPSKREATGELHIYRTGQRTMLCTLSCKRRFMTGNGRSHAPLFLGIEPAQGTVVIANLAGVELPTCLVNPAFAGAALHPRLLQCGITTQQSSPAWFQNVTRSTFLSGGNRSTER